MAENIKNLYVADGREEIKNIVNLYMAIFTIIIIIFIILPAAPGPGVYSACNRNEYQKHKNNHVLGE
jgi:ABC-type dipeptide/oligopeptide/nickel transport system permease component